MFYPKLLVGNFLKQIGWDLRPSWKFPICSIELAGVGLALIRAKKEGEPIHVIQVGAFDGTTSDPLCAFLGADDIRAFLLEPQSVPFEKMSALYRNSNRIIALNMALADHDGLLKMSTSVADGSATASTIIGHNKRFGIESSALKEIEVPCLTAHSLLEMTGWSKIDFLQVDVEGYDWQVVKHFLKIEQKPLVINFEMLHLDKKTRIESTRVLAEIGYQFIDSRFDRTAFHRDILK